MSGLHFRHKEILCSLKVQQPKMDEERPHPTDAIGKMSVLIIKGERTEKFALDHCYKGSEC